MHTPYPNYKGQVRYEIGKSITGDIPYNINSMGTRGPEIDLGAPSVITLGGSNVFGVGNYEKDIWPQLLANHLDLQLVNLARSAAAPDTCFRMISQWVRLCKNIKYVIYFEPPPGRFEILKHNYQDLYDPGIYSAQNTIIDQWFATDQNTDLNYMKNMLAIEALCKQNDISFYGCKEPDFILSIDHAADGIHMGTKSHKKTFEKILTRL